MARLTSLDQRGVPGGPLRGAGVTPLHGANELATWTNKHAVLARSLLRVSGMHAQLAGARDPYAAQVLTDIAHDLRNPLNTIALQLELVRRSGLARDVPRPIERIGQAVVQLDQLIHDLLDVGYVTPPATLAEGLLLAPRDEFTILMVEDDLAARTALQELLTDEGFRVLAAESGGAGLELFDQHRGEIHLLLTDIALGEINGVELATRLRQRQANLPVLFMSGMLAAPRDCEAVFIAKPIDVDELVELLEQTLARAY